MQQSVFNHPTAHGASTPMQVLSFTHRSK